MFKNSIYDNTHLIKPANHYVQKQVDWTHVQHYEIAIVTGIIAVVAYLILLFCDHIRNQEIMNNPLISIKAEIKKYDT